jgi:4-aminobutyrate aminotransferase
LVVKEARGCVVKDVDGNLFLDFMAGIAVASTGHSHPKVVKAIEEQARKFLHVCGSDFYYGPMAELAAKLSEIAPGQGAKKVFFTNSGTETIEAAIKLARYHTKRQHIIAFHGAFHGRSLGSLSLTASRASHRAHFGPLLPGVHHVPYGFCRRCPYHLTYGTCGIECVGTLEKTLFRHDVAPSEVAALFVEPIQGEGGYVVPPPEYLPMLQDLCRRHGILLVVDEIQSGFGRTGKMFACEQGHRARYSRRQKGIASGMPLGAMIAREEISTWTRGTHGSTFGGNPVACAAALATIALIEDGLVENAAEVGGYLNRQTQPAQSQPFFHWRRARPRAHDRRGICAARRQSRARCRKLRDQVMQKCFEKGLLLLSW